MVSIFVVIGAGGGGGRRSSPNIVGAHIVCAIAVVGGDDAGAGAVLWFHPLIPLLHCFVLSIIPTARGSAPETGWGETRGEPQEPPTARHLMRDRRCPSYRNIEKSMLGWVCADLGGITSLARPFYSGAFFLFTPE